MSHNPALAPCNICGSEAFVADSNAASSAAKRASKCAGCGALAQHRVARAVFNAFPRELLQGAKCLRMTADPSLDPAWFAQVEAGALPTESSPSMPAASASYAWVCATLPLQGNQPAEAALLQELLRVAGRRCLVLIEEGAGTSLRGSAYGDALHAALPKAAVLELTGLDPSSLKLESVYFAALDAQLLTQLAEAVVRHNIHARVLPAAEPTLTKLRASLPPELDLAVYRSIHPDLAKFSDQSLLEHYREYGQREGRRSNSLVNRSDFVALLGEGVDVLEIGPFYLPLARGPRVRYFDIYNQQELKSQALAAGQSPAGVPDEIHFVSRDADLGVVTGDFDLVISSHVVEHQPDFIGHLDSVRRLLRPGGLYFALIPDKNYCFDHFNAPSSIADLLEAHFMGRTRHSLRADVNFALRAHNDLARHWRGDHGTRERSVELIQAAVKSYQNNDGSYGDSHGWYFEPAAFRESMSILRELGETDFSVLRLYPSRRNSNEFWVVLAADGAAS